MSRSHVGAFMDSDDDRVSRSVQALIAAYGEDAINVAKSRLKDAIEQMDESAIGYWAAVLPAIAKAQREERSTGN